MITVATCNLNQWALDFAGNVDRVRRSIIEAKLRGARYRLGPELELCGYGCQDHYLEPDTFAHSWEALADLLADPELTRDCLCDIGMPVMHLGVRYNCRVLVLDRRVLLVRPKQVLCQDGTYHEARWFQAWTRLNAVDSMRLPDCVVKATEGGQPLTVPIGDAVLELADTRLGVESCEELFAPVTPFERYSLGGVEVVGNGSGSHHTLRKLSARAELMRAATHKLGGVYLYANQQGCDGDRLYYDGSCMVWSNGQLLAQGQQFSPRDVEVSVATIDLDDVRAFRSACNSRCVRASQHPPLQVVRTASSFHLGGHKGEVDALRGGWSVPSVGRPLRLPLPAEEICHGPAQWLWDYLRRSGQRGFFVPLSGGADSASVLGICGYMCQMLCAELSDFVEDSGDDDKGNAAGAGGDANKQRKGVLQLSRLRRDHQRRLLADVRRVVREPVDSSYVPRDSRELASRLLHTAYLSSPQSGETTRERAARLADQVGAYHINLPIDTIVSATLAVFKRACRPDQPEPRFKVHGGSSAEDLAVQNVQARTRMVVSYLLGQLLPWARGSSGSLLVLAAGNVDEALRGYLTKYDCSSGDLNPIGSISKVDLRMFLRWASDKLGYPELGAIAGAPPTAELTPAAADGHEQRDEDADQMGMTYAELSEFGRLRKVQACGPVGMYRRLLHVWPTTAPREIAVKVKHFFRCYAINRHKSTTLTPAYHAEAYSPDDNRFDMRPFLYNVSWPWQFAALDRHVEADQPRWEQQAKL